MAYKNSILFFTVLLLLGTVTSCCSNQQKQNSTYNQIISFTEIAKGGHSHIETASNVIIKDPTQLQKLFDKINLYKEPKEKTPTIDFEKEMLIGLFMGMKSTGGYSIRIDSIVSQSKELIIYIKESKPKGMTSMVMTQPYYIAKTQKTDKTVVFK